MPSVLDTVESLDSFAVPPYPVRRFSVAEYHVLAETGVLENGVRTELLKGWIVPTATKSPPHAWTVTHVAGCIRESLTADWLVRIRCAITTKDSEPEPDLAIIRSPNNRYATRHPRGDDIGLIIEVADTTLRQDRRKAEIYAADEIAVYWIINLVDRQIEVHTDPDAANRTYRDREVFTPGQSVDIELDGNVVQTIAVDDLLPPTTP